MGGETLYDSVRVASVTGIPLTESCNKLLFAIVSMIRSLSMTHSLIFPFLVFTVINLLFNRLHHFIGSSQQAVAILQNGPQVRNSWTTLM